MTTIRGLLIDLDGTVYEGTRPVPGAAEAIASLRTSGVPFLFTTNTSRMSRADVAASLGRMGLETREEEILTAPVAAAAWLRSEGLRRLHPLIAASTHADFAGFELTESEAEAVLVGDLGDGFTFPRLNAAFRSLRAGARLVAIHRNRYWIPEEGPTLDAGPFVAALEYAADVRATLVGKPSPEFFRMAAARLGLTLESLAVVGDDPESDIRGGRRAGLATIQVRTGKFDPGRLARSPEEELPRHVVDSLRDVPALLG